MRIKHYPIERNYRLNSSLDDAPNNLFLKGSDYTDQQIKSFDKMVFEFPTVVPEQTYEANTWLSCNINPLCHVTVKALLLDHTNHYIFAPLATIFDNVVGLSSSKFITANMISFFHVGVACAAGKLIASDSLGYRRIGVVLFQTRTFLDDLDGHVARVKKNIRGERSEVGTSGYYIDGICDALGCIALLIGMFLFLKNNPPRRGYSQLPMTETKVFEPVVVAKTKSISKKVAKKVMCFTGQLLLSSTAWNRYIAVYQEMLERNDISAEKFSRQNIIFKSTWFFCISWLWRIINVHSLLHCVLLSIFCDKLWEFLKFIQYIGYVALLIAICLSEMHVKGTYNFVFVTMPSNDTSL